MKIKFLALGLVVWITSCNTQPQPDTNRSSGSTADTTGLAQFRAMKAQNELGMKQDENKEQKNPSSETAKKNTVPSSSSTNHSEGTSPGATHRKGWSKTAKGAVIGGVVGAGTGAAVNKKNRAAGAVIGGVIGAGTGAVIGHEMDKKDGRH